MFHSTDASKQRHAIRKKMGQEKVKLREKCVEYNRYNGLFDQRGQFHIPDPLLDEEDPVWPSQGKKSNLPHVT